MTIPPPNWQIQKTTVLILLTTVLIFVLFSSITGSVAAQDDLSLELNMPTEAEVGEDITITAEVTIPDLYASHESDLTLTLFVDGQETAKETLTVADGETTAVSFEHTFESAGTHDVETQAEITIAGQSLSNSITREIDVTEIDTTVPTTTTSEPAPTQTQVNGAAFTVPESIEDDINQYRENSPLDLGTESFIVATTEELYIVFTDQTPVTGMAEVQGVTADHSLTVQGHSFSGIAATSVSFTTDGDPASLQEITNNPGSYELELVEITATHRRISSLTDPDLGSGFTIPSSSGLLVKEPQSTSELFNQPGEQARSFSINTSTEERGLGSQGELDSRIGSKQSGLYTYGFQTKFWQDTKSTVDGIVLLPGSKAREFISTFDEAGLARSESDEPILYVVDDQIEAEAYDNIRTLNQEATDGDIVALESRVFGMSTSVQETIEHNSACSQDEAQIPTPSGPLCVNVVQDVLIDTGVAWTSTPESEDDVLFIAGFSSGHLDEPTTDIQGQYTIIGEIVSTARVDETLPDGKILLVYEFERTGDIDYSGVDDNAQGVIERQFDELKESIETQILGLETVDQTQLDPGDDSTDATSQQDDDPTSDDRADADPGTEDEGILSRLSGFWDDLSETLPGPTEVADSVSNLVRGLFS